MHNFSAGVINIGTKSAVVHRVLHPEEQIVVVTPDSSNSPRIRTFEWVEYEFWHVRAVAIDRPKGCAMSEGACGIVSLAV